jgi:hypothetical protein
MPSEQVNFSERQDKTPDGLGFVPQSRESENECKVLGR